MLFLCFLGSYIHMLTFKFRNRNDWQQGCLNLRTQVSTWCCPSLLTREWNKSQLLRALSAGMIEDWLLSPFLGVSLSPLGWGPWIWGLCRDNTLEVRAPHSHYSHLSALTTSEMFLAPSHMISSVLASSVLSMSCLWPGASWKAVCGHTSLKHFSQILSPP